MKRVNWSDNDKSIWAAPGRECPLNDVSRMWARSGCRQVCVACPYRDTCHVYKTCEITSQCAHHFSRHASSCPGEIFELECWCRWNEYVDEEMRLVGRVTR